MHKQLTPVIITEDLTVAGTDTDTVQLTPANPTITYSTVLYDISTTVSEQDRDVEPYERTVVTDSARTETVRKRRIREKRPWTERWVAPSDWREQG